MDDSISHILAKVVIFSNFAVLPPVMLLGLRWKKLSVAQKFFGRLLIAICIIQLIAWARIQFFHATNLPFYHLYIWVEASGLWLLFRYRLKQAPWKKLLLWAAIAWIGFVPINAWLIEDLFKVPVIARSAEAFVMLLIGLLYFRAIFLEMKVTRLTSNFWFWLSTGLLFYFTANLLLFMFNNQLKGRELLLGVWTIHALLNFMLYGFYFIALLCRDREHSSYS